MKKLLLLCLALLMLTACASSTAVDGKKDIDTPAPLPGDKDPSVDVVPVPEVPVKTETRISLCAAGDNLLHNSVTYSVQTGKNTFDFTPIYAPIKEIVQNHTIAFVNQEIPLGGVEFGIGAYPSFNGPIEAAQALYETGFNVINLASNHALDKGLKGALASYENIKASGFTNIIGSFPDKEKVQDFCVIEEEGIKIGFLSYSYGTNGIPLPKGQEQLVPLIDLEKIKQDIAVISPKCDVLAVSLHWGNEYQTTPSKEQKELAAQLADLGVDLIIGHHPHVLQPVEVVETAAGNKVTCIYSLGNFVSNQQKAATMLGGIATLDIVKTVEDTFEIQNVGVIPVVTHYTKGSKSFGIYPLAQYTGEQAKAHGILSYDSKFSLDYLNQLADQVLGQYRKNNLE